MRWEDETEQFEYHGELIVEGSVSKRITVPQRGPSQANASESAERIQAAIAALPAGAQRSQLQIKLNELRRG